MANICNGACGTITAKRSLPDDTQTDISPCCRYSFSREQPFLYELSIKWKGKHQRASHSFSTSSHWNPEEDLHSKNEVLTGAILLPKRLALQTCSTVFPHYSCHEHLWKRPYPSVLHSASSSTVIQGKDGLHTGMKRSQPFTTYPYHTPSSYRKDTSFTKLLSWRPILIWHFATQLVIFPSPIFVPSKPYHVPLPTLPIWRALHKYSSFPPLPCYSWLLPLHLFNRLTFPIFLPLFSAFLLSILGTSGVFSYQYIPWSQTLALCLHLTEQ